MLLLLLLLCVCVCGYCFPPTARCLDINIYTHIHTHKHTLPSSATLATTLGILLWLCSFFIPGAIMYDYNNETLAAKLLSCLLPNMAITWAFKVMSLFEGRSKSKNKIGR